MNIHENEIYRHSQSGWLTILLIVLPILVIIYVSIVEKQPILLITALIFILPVFLFYNLSVSITDRRIKFWFGIGLIRKSIELQDIVSSRQVRNKWYYGWGIKKIPGGWMYNIVGLDAVEIGLKDGKKFRIGTDDPQMLNEMIQNVIRK